MRGAISRRFAILDRAVGISLLGATPAVAPTTFSVQAPKKSEH